MRTLKGYACLSNVPGNRKQAREGLAVRVERGRLLVETQKVNLPYLSYGMPLLTEIHDLFTESFKSQPYWWEGAPLSHDSTPGLPAEADVVVVGSGYTGLHAALQTAKAGLSTLVLDAEAIGWGCSRRNGGQVSTSIKPSYAALSRRYGPD